MQEWRLLTNLQFWSQPTNYFRFARMFSPGLFAPRGGNLLIVFLLLIPSRFGWKHLREEIRHATVLLALAYVPLFLFFGCIDETRALAPLSP